MHHCVIGSAPSPVPPDASRGMVVEGDVPGGFGDERRCAPKCTRYATGWPARSRTFPGPAPAIFVEAEPRAGRRRWSGPHRSRSGCRCGPTAGSRPLGSNRVLPSPPGPFTNANTRMTPRWASSSNGPTACGPSGSAMIASAAPAPSQLGSGRPAGLGGGRRRHHGPRQPGRGRHRTDRAAPVTTEDHLSGRAVVHRRQVRAAGGMRPSPGLRRPPAGTAPLCRCPPGRHSQRRVSRRSCRSCRRAWMRSCRRVWRRS
jgi:hypothetical protein